MIGCVACDLSAGRRPLPGGLIHRTPSWLVEHCVGPLGVGTLIVKPQRHVTNVADLEDSEAAELGGLLTQTARVVRRLAAAEQVYVCLWSHAGGEPGHIHFVVQPVTRQEMDRFGLHGPKLQVALFDEGVGPDPAAVSAIADEARRLYLGPSGGCP